MNPTPVAPNLARRLAENLRSVEARIARASARAGREPGSVKLVAVTKRHPTDLVRPLVAAGASVLGENYPQELWAKADDLADLPVAWHLIGHLQGNKARRLLPIVRMIHGVDSLKLLQSLDDLVDALALADPASVCLQVNTSGEETKHGWTPEGLLADAEAIAAIARIRVVGLMTIAGYDTDNETARPCFVALRELRDRLRLATGLPLPELSIGMSGDFEAAIAEGSTIVRVGSALFEGIGS